MPIFIPPVLIPEETKREAFKKAETERLINQGMSREEAHRAATETFNRYYSSTPPPTTSPTPPITPAPETPPTIEPPITPEQLVATSEISPLERTYQSTVYRMFGPNWQTTMARFANPPPPELAVESGRMLTPEEYKGWEQKFYKYYGVMPKTAEERLPYVKGGITILSPATIEWMGKFESYLT